MAVKVDQTGIPSAANVVGFTNADIAVVKQEPEQPQVGFRAVVGKLLSVSEEALNIIVDTNGRKVHCDSTVGSDIATGVNQDVNGGAEFVQLIPSPGQDGRTLTWDVAGGLNNDPWCAAMKAVVAAVKPVMSLETLVQRLIAAAPEGTYPVIRIRQDNGTVWVVNPLYGSETPATRTADFNATTLSGAKTARITLENPTVEGEAEPLKFEGGSF